MRYPDMNIAKVLVKHRFITDEELFEADRRVLELGRPVEDVLISMGLVTARDIARAAGLEKNVEFIDLDNESPDPEALRRISPDIARRLRAVPVRFQDNRLYVAMANPFDKEALDEIHQLHFDEVIPLIADEPALERAIEQAYGKEPSRKPSPDKTPCFSGAEDLERMIRWIAEDFATNMADRKITGIIFAPNGRNTPVFTFKAPEKPWSGLGSHVIWNIGRNTSFSPENIGDSQEEFSSLPTPTVRALTRRFKQLAGLDPDRTDINQAGFFQRYYYETYTFHVATHPHPSGEVLALWMEWLNLEPTAGESYELVIEQEAGGQ